MATYKIYDLIEKLYEISADGYEYVDIFESECDDEYPASLSFSAISNDSLGIDYEEIESCEIPDNYDYEESTRKINSADFCLQLPFTYQEIFTIKHAVDNALEYFKECIENPEISKDIKTEIKTSSVSCRNLQAKINKFLSKLKPC